MTNDDATVPLLIAVRAMLLGDPDITSYTTQVYDLSPPTAKGTWITIGNVAGTDFSTQTTSGQSFMTDISVWHQPASQGAESKVVRAIMAAIRKIFHFKTMVLSDDNSHVLTYVMNTTPIMLQPDETTLQGVVTIMTLTDRY